MPENDLITTVTVKHLDMAKLKNVIFHNDSLRVEVTGEADPDAVQVCRLLGVQLVCLPRASEGESSYQAAAKRFLEVSPRKRGARNEFDNAR